MKANNTTILSLLNGLFGKEIDQREVGNHLILIRKKNKAPEKQNFPKIIVSGFLLDAFDRKPLKDVSVYEVENSNSAISHADGSYKLLIPTGKKVRSLTYCKAGYSDTVIFISQAAEIRVDIVLRPIQKAFSKMNALSGALMINRTDSMRLVNLLVSRENMVHSQNLEIGTDRTFQASLVPGIGTNGKVSGAITNRFSLNLLVGYSGGLKGFEAGGALNITRGTINGLQIGGLGNISGGKGKGLQIAGLTNITTDQFDAWQISGLLNLTLKDARQVQGSVVMNYARNVDGFQLAGILNIARNHNDGVQIAGILNYATILNGIQIGLINISNTVERGIPIGLFSYVEQGYHLFEISGNEIFYGNAAFKSGTRSFYNFIQFGIGSDYKLQGSYGIGTIFQLRKKFSVNIDASAGFVYHPTGTIYHGLLLKFNPAIEYRFAKHFAVFLGPGYNFFLFSKGEPSATPRGLSNYDFYFKSTEHASIQMWIGGVVGIRI